MTSRVRVSARSRPSPPFIPTLIGLRAFDLMSSPVWWEAATNIYPPFLSVFLSCLSVRLSLCLHCLCLSVYILSQLDGSYLSNYYIPFDKQQMIHNKRIFFICNIVILILIIIQSLYKNNVKQKCRWNFIQT